MINKSKLFSSVKMDLSLYALHLPFDLNEAMENVLELKTLPVYSELFPMHKLIEVDFSSMEKIEGNYSHSVYKVPQEIADMNIHSILNYEAVGSDYSRCNMVGGIEVFETLIMAQARADLTSSIMDSMTIDFEAPNKLHIYNLDTNSNYKFRLNVALYHSNNLVTIPQTQYISFHKLFDLDVKSFLYNNMKHYTEIQTQHGNISLKIDDWADAINERKALLEEWENNYHLEQELLYIL